MPASRIASVLLCASCSLSCACAPIFLSRFAAVDSSLAHEHGEHHLRAGLDACKSVSSSGVTANRLARERFCVCSVRSVSLGCACREVAISPLATPGSCPRYVHNSKSERCDLSVSMTVLAGFLPAYRHRLRDMLFSYAHSSLCRVEVRQSFLRGDQRLGGAELHNGDGHVLLQCAIPALVLPP